MIARLDPVFSNYLLKIGNGIEQENDDGYIKLSRHIIIPYEDDTLSLKKLINIVFSDIVNYANNIDLMINRAILIHKNDYVDEINKLLLQEFSGAPITYYSFDEEKDKNDQGFQEDFLHTLTPNGVPPHELLLKPNCPVILLRNIDPTEGLCNGTCLIC